MNHLFITIKKGFVRFRAETRSGSLSGSQPFTPDAEGAVAEILRATQALGRYTIEIRDDR